MLPHPPKGRLEDLIEAAIAGRLLLAGTHLRSKVEHPFRVIKQQFGCWKTRLRGLAMNDCKIHGLAALTNRLMARRQLLPTA